MDSVHCKCRRCSTVFGAFVNLWTQVGKAYLAPVLEATDGPSVICHGSARFGEQGTVVAGCHLQDLLCCKCSALLGIYCVSTPTNHVFNRNQILLRVASVVSVHRDTDEEVGIVVKRTLELRNPPPATAAGASSSARVGSPAFDLDVNLIQLQNAIENQRDDINRLDTEGAKILKTLGQAVSQIEDEARRMKDSILSLRQDVGEAQRDVSGMKTEVGETKKLVQDSSALSRLESQLKDVKTSIGEVRRENAASETRLRREIGALRSDVDRRGREIGNLKAQMAGYVAAADHALEMAAVRSGLEEVRKMAENAASRNADLTGAPYPFRELDILTASIAKIGNRASQVETLQMELEILKGRVGRFETSEGRPRMDTGHMSAGIQVDHTAATTRKRPAPGPSMTSERDLTGPKRGGLSFDATGSTLEDYSPPPGFPTSDFATASSLQTRVPRTGDLSSSGSKPRLTKAGRVDRRAMRGRTSINEQPSYREKSDRLRAKRCDT